ncbi:von Willebrand factor A domain-containing protein 7-like [Festucalex cinctus]
MSNTYLILLLVVITFPGLNESFNPLSTIDRTSITHYDITLRAILRKTAEVCRACAAAEGRNFSLTIDDGLTIAQVHQACFPSNTSSSVMSSRLFASSIGFIYENNALVDLNVFTAAAHFNDETFQLGRGRITQGLSEVKNSVREGRFLRGQRILGMILHTLQDFYSHSNWVELGNAVPYNVLISSGQPLENLAGPNTPTCRNCDEDNCDDNILPNVLVDKLLTSGYFSTFSSEKPQGKCSHGGLADQTSRTEPTGGINKDQIGSDHGSLHFQAADLAVAATMELLEDIRVTEGDKNFLRLMGLFQAAVLCYVIDTTGSMFDEIAEAKRVAFEIIDRRRGTLREPPSYILVPFNDPGFGPLLVTSDADLFKDRINALTATGGGDNPELSLSGLQLALTAAPPSSDIFVFTDAPAKDAHLKSTVIALIENTKSVVTFLLTDVLSSRRKRVVTQADAQLYRDIAITSGGQTIEVSQGALPLVTSIIEDSTEGAMVTVFQEVSSKPEKFSFIIDSSLRNTIVSITGNSALRFNLTSSTGVTQNSSELDGPLGSLSVAGNLQQLRLNNDSQTGLWEINVDFDDLYSVKVTGQSPVDFINNLVEESEVFVGDIFLKEGRPLSGDNATIFLTVTGSDSVNLTEVMLYDSTGPTEVNGTLQSFGATNFLVSFNEIPAGVFVVRLRGELQDNSSSPSTQRIFQRQDSTQIRTSNIIVTAQVNTTNIEPGSTISIPFTVTVTTRGFPDETANATEDASTVLTVRATNDRGFDLSSPMSVTVEEGSGGKANFTVRLTAPENVTSGTDVTLTTEVENDNATDLNFVVLRFSVAEMADVLPPVCQQGSTSTDCPSSSESCDSSQWVFVVNVTDGIDGVGLDNITIREGNGTLNTTTVVGPGGQNITIASYEASCCDDIVELSAVDKEGNEAICSGQAGESTMESTTVTTTTTTTVTPVITENENPDSPDSGGHTFHTSQCLWMTVVSLILWR